MGSLEHMWVLCTGRARNGKKELGGILLNDPIFVDNLRHGDWVEFSRSEIEDVWGGEHGHKRAKE